MARFLAEISRMREKPIKLMRGNLPAAMPTGMVLRTHTADYIAGEAAARAPRLIAGRTASRGALVADADR